MIKLGLFSVQNNVNKMIINWGISWLNGKLNATWILPSAMETKNYKAFNDNNVIQDTEREFNYTLLSKLRMECLYT